MNISKEKILTKKFRNSMTNERLYKVIEAFFKESKPDNFIPLKGGGSKATLYRFDIDQRSYVLRLLPAHDDTPTRLHQISLAKQAGNIGIGPKIHFVDSQMEGMIMDFIPGRTVQPEDFVNCENLAVFAKFLRRLHKSNEHFPIAVSPFKRFHNFALKEKVTFPSRFPEVKMLMKEMESKLQFQQVPTHLDLHPLNILSTGKQFYLVDWVNGGMSDPYFDLATFAFFHDLNESQITTFLTHYFERSPTQSEWDRFIITQPIRLFVIAAALLSSSTDENRSTSYDEALSSLKLPSMHDLGKNENIPLWSFGLTMLKSGLELIDQKNYRKALNANLVSL